MVDINPGGNGHGGTTSPLKMCPFWQKWCDKDLQGSCALHVEINKQVGGVVQKLSMCGFNALGLILSEINQKTPAPMPSQMPIRLPNIHRG